MPWLKESRDAALEEGLISNDDWERGIRDLHRTTECDGVFCYTFFKATGYNNEDPIGKRE
jgi:hypothetical protein